MDTLKYKVTFQKRGLTPNEFEDCLTSKVNELFKIITIPRIVTLKKKSVEKVRKTVCIRENRTNDHLDQRNTLSISEHVSHGTLSNLETTPVRDKQDTGGQQGTQRSDRRIQKQYHNTQHDLFSSDSVLSQKCKSLFPQIKLKENKKGSFFHRDTENKLTTVEYCNVIDEITTDYIRADLRELSYCSTNHNYDQAMREDYDHCKEILIGRVALDWAIDNNLMVEDGYEQWRRHILVEMSYAALLVVLDMILSRLNPPPPPPTAIMTYMKPRFLFIIISIIGLYIWNRGHMLNREI